MASRLPRCVHVQTDVVRSMISHPRYTSAESRFVYATSTGIAGQALRDGYDAILDGTFPRQEYRRQAMAELAHLFVRGLVVHVACEPALALRRNAERRHAVPEETILRIQRNFQAPRNALTLDTGLLAPEEAAYRVLASME